MAGTVTVTKQQLSHDKKCLTIKLACVGDSEDGTVPDTEIDNSDLDLDGYCKQDDGTYSLNYYQSGFSLEEVWVVVGDTAPDEAGVTITDALGRQLYTEADVIPATGSNEGTVTTRRVVSALTVAVANQDTVDATYDIYLMLTK